MTLLTASLQSVIGVNLQNIQNSPTNWVDPRGFHPERFLDEKDPRYDARFAADDKRAFQPFATGPRNCMGGKYVTPLSLSRFLISICAFNDIVQPPRVCSNFFELSDRGRVFLGEARVIVAKMLWNFEMHLVENGTKDWLDQKAYLVFEPTPLVVSLKERH